MASSGIAHNSRVEASKDQNYEELKKEHLRAKKLFVDRTFVYNGTVKRPKDISKTPKFISNGMTRADVVQGYLGNCWFMSAAASLTLRPQLLQHVVPPCQDFDCEYAGIFHFRFWQFGKWVDVVVDDQLPLDETGKTLKYGTSTDENEFWMPLLEKAYAKLKGSYEAIDGGFSKNAFVNLTGGIGELIKLRCCDPENLCKRAERALGRNSVMAAGILRESEEGLQGLFNLHSYSVTKIHKVTVEGKKMTLVRLRNPHGETEWTGDWSDDE
uniref:Uncharacterized protein n=1 Tax=Sphaerodactylus townsendi TaxID=933632 RepID=A0ACB8FST7_9SAUR